MHRTEYMDQVVEFSGLYSGPTGLHDPVCAAEGQSAVLSSLDRRERCSSARDWSPPLSGLPCIKTTPKLPNTSSPEVRPPVSTPHIIAASPSTSPVFAQAERESHSRRTDRDKGTASTMIEGTRRRFLYHLNSRWIYGKVPLLHAAVFLLQMAAVSLLTRKFNSYYAQRPVLTTMITNAVLGGIADTVAQTLTAVRQRAVRKGDKDDFLAIEIHEIDRRNPFSERDLIPDSKLLPPPFDFERLTRFMSYGFLMAPVQHKWFGFLTRTFPMSKTSAMVPALKRMALDQLMFSPVGLACFFTFMTVAEGGGKRAVARKFQDIYIPALKANYLVWPAVQIINFRLLPIQLQIPFVSTIGIAWTAYLSLTNSAEEA
ncbi:Mpv17/PMP22 family protein (vacuolar membrane protein) [Paraphaeosphaeria sporulosa]